MKKIIMAVVVLFALADPGPVFGTSVISPKTHLPPITWLNMKANEFVKLTAKDYSRISGKKMSLQEKFAFMVLKKNLKHELKKNPNLTVQEYMLVAGQKKMSTGAWIAIIAGVILLVIIILASIPFSPLS